MLTTKQESHFETFGFLAIRQYLSPDKMETLTHQFDDVLAKDQSDNPTKQEEQQITTIVEHSQFFTQLVESDCIYKVIEQLMPGEFIWSGSQGNLTIHSEHRWHADRPGIGEADYMRIKVMIYLDPVTKERGCLRVIPGSHRLPLHTDLQPLIAQKAESCRQTFGINGIDLPCFPLDGARF